MRFLQLYDVKLLVVYQKYRDSGQDIPLKLKEKQKRLIGYMFQSHPSSEERKAWKSFSLFWQFWAEEKIDKS
ncbi:hypothetical protein HMPREF9349_01781, partial [Escherichia coli MS 79-10]